MNRFTVTISTGIGNEFENWEFEVITIAPRERVEELLEKHKGEFNNPVELLDYLNEKYGIAWEDYESDISIRM